MGSFMDLLFDAAGRLMSKERLRSGLRPAQCPVDQAEEKSWRKASTKSSIVWEKIRYKMFTKFISLASKAPTTAHHPTTRYNDVKNDAKKKKVYIAKCMDKWIFQKTLKSRSKWVSCKM